MSNANIPLTIPSCRSSLQSVGNRNRISRSSDNYNSRNDNETFTDTVDSRHPLESYSDARPVSRLSNRYRHKPIHADQIRKLNDSKRDQQRTKSYDRLVLKDNAKNEFQAKDTRPKSLYTDAFLEQ